MPSVNVSRGRPLLLIIAYLGFVSLGLPDTLIGVAWPSVREGFGLRQDAVAVVFLGAGAAYFLSSFLTGRMLQRWGIGLLLAGSSALVAAGNFGYALAPVWLVFALCPLVHGLGSGAIDAGLNHYVAHHFPARHMNWLHACWTLGATLGPLVMTAAITRPDGWRLGYGVVALALLVLAVLFALTRGQWRDGSMEEETPRPEGTLGEAVRNPLIRLQVVIYFFYTGLEMTLGQWSFSVLTASRGMADEGAGLWVAGFWGGLLVGRILTGFVVERVGIDRWLRWSMVTTVVATGVWLGVPKLAPGALVLAGLGLAGIYPCLMTRTPERAGRRTAAHAIGLQVAVAILGAAAIPGLGGWLAERLGLAVLPWLTLGLAVLLLFLHERLLRCGSGR